MGLQVLVVHIPVLQGLFGTVALQPLHWIAAVGLASLVLGIGELDKAVRRSLGRRGRPGRKRAARRQ